VIYGRATQMELVVLMLLGMFTGAAAAKLGEAFDFRDYTRCLVCALIAVALIEIGCFLITRILVRGLADLRTKDDST
jgi:hypothetical protein